MAPKRLKRRLHQQASAAVESNNSLPTCEGPKLGKFEHDGAAIKFVKVLSAGTPGDDGHVFEVLIESKRYALKMASDPGVVETMYKLISNSPPCSLPFSILQVISRI